jgi:hypothetical protein
VAETAHDGDWRIRCGGDRWRGAAAARPKESSDGQRKPLTCEISRLKGEAGIGHGS